MTKRPDPRFAIGDIVLDRNQKRIGEVVNCGWRDEEKVWTYLYKVLWRTNELKELETVWVKLLNGGNKSALERDLEKSYEPELLDTDGVSNEA